MNATIRYAIQVTTHNRQSVTGFVTRSVGLHTEGSVGIYVEDAKTFASPKTAQKWMDERPEWVEYLTKNGGTVAIVPVKMGQRYKTVPVALAA